jgi:hypothetical protein
MMFSAVRAAILRDAAKTPLLRMTSEIGSFAGATKKKAPVETGA